MQKVVSSYLGNVSSFVYFDERFFKVAWLICASILGEPWSRAWILVTYYLALGYMEPNEEHTVHRDILDFLRNIV